MQKHTVALIGTLDTKEEEMRYAARILQDNGVNALLLDATVRHPMAADGAVSNLSILKSAGRSWAELEKLPKDERLLLMADCICTMVMNLYAADAVHGVLTVGGAQNTSVSLKTMHSLPLGFPKMLLSTVASGSRPFSFIMGTTDMVVAQAVADISGLNFLTRNAIENAAHVMLGLLRARAARTELLKGPERPAVGMTLLGVTNIGGEICRELLEKKGFETVCFHATGTGGQVLDDMVSNTDHFQGVLDLTPHELVGEVMGGYTRGTCERVAPVCRRGIPLVLAPGAMDLYMVDLNRQSLPEDLSSRKYLYHTSTIVHVKLTEAEASHMAGILASRLNLNPVNKAVFLPLRGFVEEGGPGGRMYAPEVDRAFMDTLKKNLHPSIRVEEMECNITDRAFASAMVEELAAMMPSCGAVPYGETEVREAAL